MDAAHVDEREDGKIGHEADAADAEEAQRPRQPPDQAPQRVVIAGGLGQHSTRPPVLGITYRHQRFVTFHCLPVDGTSHLPQTPAFCAGFR